MDAAELREAWSGRWGDNDYCGRLSQVGEVWIDRDTERVLFTRGDNRVLCSQIVHDGIHQPDDWCVYGEYQGGNSVSAPHPDEEGGGQNMLALWLADFGLTREELDAATEGVRWHD